jgi:tetratricopeptide (TPR) repeat protein
MQIPISVAFPIPTDDDDFEDLCLDLLRRFWGLPGLERYGTKGQKQDGVDILDLGGTTPLRAAQCKLKEYNKYVTPADIDEEVTKALRFTPPIGKYAILTTAKVSTQAQNKILEINTRHRQSGKFPVEIYHWGMLCRLLQEYEDVCEKFYKGTVITATSRIGSKSPIVQAVIRQSSTVTLVVDLTADIDEAHDAIQRRDFQVGLLLLNRILQRNATQTISPHDRFRISSNLGFAELGLNHPEIAGDHFLQAYSFKTNDETAQINEVFGHVLKGDHEIAYEKATAMRDLYPTSTRLASCWVNSAPSTVSINDIENRLPNTLQADGEVALAIARRALMELENEKALHHAETAAKALPQSPYPALMIARANMGLIMRRVLRMEQPISDRLEVEVRIDEWITTCISLAEKESNSYAHSEALSLRASLRINQKRLAEAETDAEKALRLDPDNHEPLMPLSLLMEITKRTEEGVELLQRVYRKNPRPEVAFMLAKSLLQRRAKDDVQTALSLLPTIDLSLLRPELRPTVVTTTVDALNHETTPQQSKDYLNSVTTAIPSVLTVATMGRIAQFEGNTNLALQYAKQAKAEIQADTRPEITGLVASLLKSLEQYDEALPLLQHLFRFNFEGFEWGHLLDCAARLHRDNVVMETCDELKRRGQDPWEVVSFEIQYVQRYSREKAVLRLNEFLAKNPGHKLAILTRSILGMQSQQPHLVESDLDRLLPVEELPLDYIIPMVLVLRFKGAGERTVDYAYRFLRLHFTDIEAHRAMIMSLMPGDPNIGIPPNLDFVDVNSAVAVYDDLTGNIRWFVLEETDAPSSDFEEISAKSPVAAGFKGKRVGKSVILAEGTMQNRTGTIRQILPKYVRRYQDSMAELQVRFPDQKILESVRIGTTKEDTEKALRTILDSVKQRETTITRLRQVYDELPMSLHLLGERFNENAYIALAMLAQEDGQSVKCAFGTPEERTEAEFAVQTASRVVVDITAVATIRLLNLDQFLLNPQRFRFRMTEGTFNELQETLLGDLFSTGTSATINYKHGVPSFVEQTAAQKAERRTQEQAFLDKLKTSVEIVSTMQLSAVEPERREPLEQMFGQYGAETMVLAAEPDSVLWTDDLIQGQLAKNEFGVKRAWTEVLVELATASGDLSKDERDRVIAGLIGMEYSATHFDTNALLKAIKITDQTPWRTPLKQFVRVFEKPTGNVQTLFAILVETIARLYREDHLAETKCRVVTAFLDALWENPHLRRNVLQIRRISESIFGLNVVGRQQFNACFDNWHRGKSEGLIIPR